MSPARRILLGLLAVASLALSSTFCRAEFPDRVVRIVVPFPAGGGADVWARTFAAKLAGRLGQPVIVENKPGANTQLGAVSVARAAADGYTLFFTSSTFIQQPALYPDLSYDVAKDFVPIGQVGTTGLVFVVNKQVAAEGMRAFFDEAKKSQKMNFGSYAQGSAGAVFGEYLSVSEGLGMTVVHYRGEGQVANDMLGETIQAAFLSIPTARPLVDAGKLRALGVLSEDRVGSLGGVATLSEQGVDVLGWKSVWIGLFAPAKTPGPVLEKLVTESRAIMADPATQQTLQQLDLNVKWVEPREFSDSIGKDMTAWAKMVDRLGIRGQ